MTRPTQQTIHKPLPVIMKNFYVFILIFSICGVTYSQNYPNFELDYYKDKFKMDSLTEFNLDLKAIYFNRLYELNLDDYYCIFQRELNYSSVDVNPYYLYSIQSITKDFTSITVLHYKEALYTNLYLLTFDQNGQKISEISVATEGGDGAWWFKEQSKFINDSILDSKYVESELIEENESGETWQTKKILTKYALSSKGEIRTIKIDSSTVKEKK